REEGICFSMQTLISKIGMALTAFVTLMVLGSYGYDELDVKDVTPELVATPEFQSVIKGNWMATTLLCGLSMAACVIPLFFYTFTEKRQVEAVARVMARKKAAGVMNEAEASEFIEQLKNVDAKTQERTYTQVAEILGWENADAVRAFIVEADNSKSTADVVDDKVENIFEDAGINQDVDNIKVEEEVKEDIAEEESKSDFNE
ncbi:MAG: hypothetical protein K2L61_03370, partial [Clostridia bacterium]|nr:hypothetical protein [Clostridia bacterium]